MDIVKRIYELGIVPVIAINDADQAVPLARALCAGGLPCAEVTFRTAAGEEAIRRMKAEVPEMLVGAGTVLTCEQVDRALAAGAEFIVSPGFNPKTVEYALSKKAVMMPGTATPGEMEQAMGFGLNVVKFFPAEQNGGLSKLKAVSAPYAGLRFMPTGGVSPKNLADYIRFEKILACGGTWMVKPELIDAGNWEEITRLTREAVQLVHGFEFSHIGINCENGDAAVKSAKILAAMFGFDFKENENSIVTAEKRIEFEKSGSYGKYGYIAIAVNSINRAVAYFQARGYEFTEEELKPLDGTQTPVFFKDELCGFAICLIEKVQ